MKASINAINKYLQKKSNAGTLLTTKQIQATWTQSAKNQAFFSAQVNKTDILDTLHDKVLKIANGEMEVGEARKWVKEFLKTDGKSALSEMGMMPVLDAKGITQVGSTARINLILEQNVRNAHAVGEWAEIQAFKSVIPKLRYKTVEDSRVREEHALLDGLVFPVDSPIWAKIYPPNDFRCRCYVEKIYSGTEEDDKLPVAKEIPEKYLASTNNQPFDFDVTKGIGLVPSNKEQWTLSLAKQFEGTLAPYIKSELNEWSNIKTTWQNTYDNATTVAQKDHAIGIISQIDQKMYQMENYHSKHLEEFKSNKDKVKLGKLKTAEKKIVIEPVPEVNEVKVEPLAKIKLTSSDIPKESYTTIDSIKLGGSTGAFVVEDEFGYRFIAKQYSGNAKQVQMEYLTNRLYRSNGLEAPVSKIKTVNGKQTLLNSWVNGKEVGNDVHIQQLLSENKAFQDGFITDCFTGNWDSIGLNWDNVFYKKSFSGEYQFTRIDNGGSLLYRASGAEKGKMFGVDVNEIQTLRDKSINPKTAFAYQYIQPKDIVKQIDTFLGNISLSNIDHFINASGYGTVAEKKALFETLKGRRTYLKTYRDNLVAELDAESLAVKQAKFSKLNINDHTTYNKITDGHKLERAGSEYNSTITSEQKHAVDEYTGGSSSKMNLDAVDGKHTALNTALDEYLKNNPDRYKGWLMRNHIRQDQIPNWKHCRENGLDFDGWLKEVESGKFNYLDNESYLSTSPSAWVLNKNTKLIIKSNGINAGAYARSISDCKNEYEYIIARDSRVKITGYSYEKNSSGKIMGELLLICEEVEANEVIAHTIPKYYPKPKDVRAKAWFENKANSPSNPFEDEYDDMFALTKPTNGNGVEIDEKTFKFEW